MKAVQMLVVAAAIVAAYGLSGCHEDRPATKVYVEQQEPQYVEVPEAPPAVIVEQRPPQPSVEFVWIDGYWHWERHRYVWVKGCWCRPPRGHAVWVGPHYDRDGHGYRYVPGHWRDEGAERRDDHGDRGGRKEPYDRGGREKHRGRGDER